MGGDDGAGAAGSSVEEFCGSGIFCEHRCRKQRREEAHRSGLGKKQFPGSFHKQVMELVLVLTSGTSTDVFSFSVNLNFI